MAAQFTAPENACYVRFPVKTSEASICVFHLCWSGYRNYGTPGYAYEPYKKNVRELPVSEYFPDGMASDPVSGQYDELRKDKAIQRIYRKVFDGTETWNNPTANNGNRLFQITAANIGAQTGSAHPRLTGSMWTVQCNLVPNYGVGFTPYIATTTGGVYWNGTAHNSTLVIMLPYRLYNTVTTAAQMKQFCKDMYDAGTPLIVQWPLATPVETLIEDELNLSYNYEDFGTEALLPVNGAIPVTTPANLQIVYQQDFTRDLVNMPKNYISKESLEDLNEQLGPALNGTISGEYNASLGRFVFSFTRNPTVAALASNASTASLVPGMTYTQSPTVNVTYTLPTPSDLTQDNTIIVDVTCSDHTIAFKDSSNAMISPQKAIAPASGVMYRFICSYAFSAWKVFALEVT